MRRLERGLVWVLRAWSTGVMQLEPDWGWRRAGSLSTQQRPFDGYLTYLGT